MTKFAVVNGVKVLAHRVDNLERPQMRTLVDNLRQKIGSGVVVLGSATDGKVSLIVGVTKDLTSRVQAGKIIGPIAQKVGGKGGGRPDLAEAGGKRSHRLSMQRSGRRTKWWSRCSGNEPAYLIACLSFRTLPRI